MNAKQVGTFRGIPVRLHWGAVIVAALLALLVANGVLPELAPGMSDRAYLVGGFIAGVALLASIFAHEASHAVVAQRYGVAVSSITLWFLGGVAHLEQEAPSPRAEARIAGAGPASSLLIAVAMLGLGWTLGLAGVSSLLSATFTWIAGLNLVLAVFNLLPGAPLDGGRLLHAWLWKRHDDRERATVGASKAGRVLGLVVAAIGVAEFFTGNPGGLWTAFIGWFLFSAAGQEAQAGKLSAVLSGHKVADVMAPIPPSVANWSFLHDVLSRQASGDRMVGVDFGGDVTMITSRSEVVRATARAAQRNATPERLRDLPIPEPIRVDENEPASVILQHPGHPILVTRDSRPVGVVTSVDLDRIVAMHYLTTEDQTVAA